jgi:hypothetical protein
MPVRNAIRTHVGIALLLDWIMRCELPTSIWSGRCLTRT